MKSKYLFLLLLLAVVIFGLQGYFKGDGVNGVCGLFSQDEAIASSQANPDLPIGDALVTFVELGSLNCIPCKKMKPIMDAIETEYAGKVRIVFHDVWTPKGRADGQKYGIRLIPTQVFLDRDGKEIFRHEGYFPKEEIEAMLAKNGVTK
jgi:thioredoxin 1